MALALFDLDRTLLTVNAGALWVRAEMRAGHITRWQATKAAAWIFGYHLGYSKVERVIEEGIATLAGQREDVVRARTAAFYEREVRACYRPGARAAVRAHLDRGDVVALLTSSSVYLSEPVQADLGIPHALCNRFEVVDGVFTGRPVLPLCFGAGKVAHARALADALGEDLARASFYTDSYSDLAAMEAVGDPVAVCPDPRLARVARGRGWRVETWGEPKA